MSTLNISSPHSATMYLLTKLPKDKQTEMPCANVQYMNTRYRDA
jgi:hypothetical protein